MLYICLLHYYTGFYKFFILFYIMSGNFILLFFTSHYFKDISDISNLYKAIQQMG